MSENIIHFDGDAIMHVIGSVAEKRWIEVKHKKTGKTYKFDNRSAFHGRSKKKNGGWLENINLTRSGENKEPYLLEDFEIVDKQEAESVDKCLHSVKIYIKNILTKLKSKNYKVYIGEGDTFRHKISMPVGRIYKQNREALTRALLLEEITKYIMKHHNGEMIKDIEVDDKLSIIAWEGYKKYLKSGKKSDDKNIIVSRDKDTAGTHGWWFNPDTMEVPVYIHGFGKIWLDNKGKLRGIGRKFKYYQLLFGDTSDGYQGRRIPLEASAFSYDSTSLLGTTKLLTYGEKAVFKDLAPLQTDKDCWELIVAKYKQWMPEELSYPAGACKVVIKDDWKSWLQKHLTFVHMKRWLDDDPRLITILDKLGVEY